MKTSWTGDPTKFGNTEFQQKDIEKEASLNRLMCEIANEIIVVTDSSKFDQRAFHVICSSTNIHSLVTDSGIPEHYVEHLTKQGVQLHIIEKTNL